MFAVHGVLLPAAWGESMLGAESVSQGNMTGNKNKTSAVAMSARDKQLKALEMRRAGHDYRTIATDCGYSNPGNAYRAVTAALRETLQEPADEVRRLEVERIDRLCVPFWPHAELGDYDALAALLKLMKRRADLLGLDAPKRLQTEDVGPQSSEVEERIVLTRTQAQEAVSALEEAGGLS